MTEGAFLHLAKAEARTLEKFRRLAEYQSQSQLLNFLKICNMGNYLLQIFYALYS